MGWGDAVKINTGDRFDRLTVISFAGRDRFNYKRWLCRCDCGAEKVVNQGVIITPHPHSCGACQREILSGRASEIHRVHGLSARPEYAVWRAMINRCHNPENKSFLRYGGRGISVCERWRNSCVAFLSDMGERPSPKHTIERINNDGGYEQSNCRWGTRLEQARNTRSTTFLEFRGQRRPLTEWANIIGIKPATVRRRLVIQGYSTERALTEPVKGKKLKCA
jgi:hypothetical protein